MRKFKIGDLVMIGEVRGSYAYVPSMTKYKNHVGKITQFTVDDKHIMFRVEGAGDWWFAEDVLTTTVDNRRFIDAFLEGKSVEVISDHGGWVRLTSLTPEIARRAMRFAKTEEVLAIENEINVLKENVDELERQKNVIIAQIKNAKARISRREKKLKTLS